MAAAFRARYADKTVFTSVTVKQAMRHKGTPCPCEKIRKVPARLSAARFALCLNIHGFNRAQYTM
jgi:hypothetical protein